MSLINKVASLIIVFTGLIFLSFSCSDRDRSYRPPYTSGGNVQGGFTSSADGGIAGGGFGGNGGSCDQPMIIASLVVDVPLVQSLSWTMLTDDEMSLAQCNGECLSDGGGGTEITDCPTSYKPLSADNCFSEITGKTNVRLLFFAPPIFEPVLDESVCTTKSQPVFNGAIYAADCSGNLSTILNFSEDDALSIFGYPTVLYKRTNTTINGHPVSILAGLIAQLALCDDQLFVLTNASTKIIQKDLSFGSGYPRIDHEVNEIGLSGLQCEIDGRVFFVTPREFTQDSWQEATSQQDASLLFESRPATIWNLNSETEEILPIVSIQGSSRVLSNLSMNTVFGGAIMGGLCNQLEYVQSGYLLFGDVLTGLVWQMSADGLSSNVLFDAGRPFTGLTMTLDGTIFIASNPYRINGGQSITGPVIAYYSETDGQVKDWLILDEPDALSLNLFMQADVLLKDHPTSRIYLGGSLIDLAPNQDGTLFVAEALHNVVSLVGYGCDFE